ncbi:MAG: HEAT repeat domain-containing protein [Anaerolineae bacterium]|nr:HEAT repeat domain-containing protein [Anaerolineae bacterium]
MRRSVWLVMIGLLLWANVVGVVTVAASENPGSVPTDPDVLDQWLLMGEPAERAAAAAAWGQIGGDDARERLMDRLYAEPDPAVGQAIARALGPIAIPAMVPALVNASQHRNPQVRWRAATVLGFIPTRESVVALGEMVRSDASIARPAASQALVRIGTAAAAEVVVPLLDTTNLTATRHAALATLEGLGEASVVPLATALLTDRRPTMRRGAAEALGWVASSRATTPLALALKDTSEAVRLEAVWALSQIRTDAARDALAAALDDPNAEVRAAAAMVLRKSPAAQPES